MAERKATVMILKVDLKCDCCYKRVKKVLCKFPQIRDRIFDEKSNTVMIKVFCCDPEMIRYKLCNKGRGSIKSIEIKEPEQHKPAENPKPEQTKPAEAPPAKPEIPKNPPPVKSPESGHNPVPKPPEPVQKSVEPPPVQPKQTPQPIASESRPVEPNPSYGSEPIPTCCEQCYGGRSGGPCNYGYGSQPGYNDAYYYGRMGYNGYGPIGGPNRLCHPGRCAEYFSEENPAGCSVM